MRAAPIQKVPRALTWQEQRFRVEEIIHAPQRTSRRRVPGAVFTRGLPV